MSVPSTPSSEMRRAERRHPAEEREGLGWVLFAGTMLLIAGTMNIVYGIGAIDEANVFINDAQYVFADLSTWGWLVLGAGIIQFAAAISIWNATEWGRWVGIVSAVGNAMLMLFFLPAFPLLAVAILTLDVLVIYGLVSYGGRRD